MVGIRRIIRWLVSTASVAACAAGAGATETLAAVQAVSSASGSPNDARVALVSDLDSIARAALATGRVAGLSVAVVHGRDTLLLHGYGRSDLELDAPMAERAVVGVASITKQFTAAAIVQLAESGKLNLDDDVRTYLPGYPAPAGPITVRRLLDHTAGIYGISMQAPQFRELATRPLPLDSIVALFAAEPLDFTPGTAMIYSNSGYFLAGRIIEEVSGTSYEDYLKSRIFDPLGLTRTRVCADGELGEERAKGYLVDPSGALVEAPHYHQNWVFGAGSLCSSAGDLVRWQQALHGGRLLGDAAYRELVTPDTLLHGHPLRYAKGLETKDDAAGHFSIGHGGTLPGFVAEARYYPAADLHVVVLINTLGPLSAEPVADALARRVLGPGTLPPPVPHPGDLDGLAGSYRGAARNEVLTVAVEREGDGLAVRVGASTNPVPVRHIGEDVFAVGKARFIFVRRDDGARELHFESQGTPSHYVLVWEP